MTRPLVLVEDDARTAELVCRFLTAHDFAPTWLSTGEGAVDAILKTSPSIVLLDWMLPGASGVDICAALRTRGFQGPILLLTARSAEADQILALDRGADDFLSKPVRPKLLLARLEALLRRSRPTTGQRTVGPIRLDRSTRQVELHGVQVVLSTAEFELLWMLAEHPGQPVGREALFLELRGIPYDGLDRAMDVRVSQLRKRLMEAAPGHADPIQTIRGHGYQLTSG